MAFFYAYLILSQIYELIPKRQKKMEKYNKNYASEYEKLTRKNQRVLKTRITEAFGFSNSNSCYYIISGRKTTFSKLEFDFLNSLFNDLFQKQLMN